VRQLSDGQLRVSDGEADETIAVRDIARLVRVDDVTPAFNDELSLLHLRNGDRLVGSVADFAGETLTFQFVPIGAVEIPIDAIDGVTPQGEKFTGEPGVQDVLTFANGDRLSGFIESFAGGQWQMVGDDGVGVSLDADAIRRVRLAGGGELAEAFEPAWVVELGNGSRLSLADPSLESGTLRGNYFGRDLEMSLTAVRSLRPIDGRVVWLRQLTPDAARLTPYFGQPTDLAVLQTSDAADASAGSFTLVSRSEVAFTVPVGATRFVTSFRIEPMSQTQLADAAVRVLVDGNVVHETPSIKPANRPVKLAIDVQPGQSLALEVDYGAGLDVQDRVLWIDPIFLRLQ